MRAETCCRSVGPIDFRPDRLRMVLACSEKPECLLSSAAISRTNFFLSSYSARIALSKSNDS
jgi:hypothetical protein